MKRYDTYKDSGIEWIGGIPSDWKTSRIRYIVDSQKGKNPKEFSFVESSNSMVYLAMDYLRGEPKQIYYIENPSEYTIVDENQILLLWDGSNAGEFIMSKKGILSSTMAILNIKYLHKRFVWYFFKYFERFLKESTIGMGIPHVNGDELKNNYISYPPLPEQTAIASFLDRKTAEIAQLIADKKRLIELYEEEKTVIINQAVTKGIDPNVKMKDSGIEWLEEIPEHWEVKRLKYVVDMKSGSGITSEMIKEEGEYPVYGGNGLRGYFNSFTHDGDFILIGRQGALCGNINYGIGKFWASEHALVCSSKSLFVIKWLGELLRVMNLNQYSVSAAQPGLSVENLKILQIPVPYLSEQFLIVSHIETECARINAKIEKTKKLIELLSEYRTTLISEVVTGKINVI